MDRTRSDYALAHLRMTIAQQRADLNPQPKEMTMLKDPSADRTSRTKVAAAAAAAAAFVVAVVGLTPYDLPIDQETLQTAIVGVLGFAMYFLRDSIPKK